MVDVIRAYSRYLEQIKRTNRCASLDGKSWSARPEVPSPAPRRLDIRLDEARLQQLLADYQAGSTGRQLAERYSLARSTVISLIRNHGVEVRHPRVTPDEAAEMVALHRAGVRQVDIAARFGRDPGNIWHVLKRAGAFEPSA